jgi:hypothetical protein
MQSTQVSTFRDSFNFSFMVSLQKFRQLSSQISLSKVNFNFPPRELHKKSRREEKNQLCPPTLACFLLRGERETTNSAYMRLTFFDSSIALELESIRHLNFTLLAHLIWSCDERCVWRRSRQCITSLEVVSHSSFAVWGLYETIQSNNSQ